ncbi:L-proline dehydrogenase /delta-1-pyrroline-5-carboxylate dehydrogenase [Rhizobiales bacterium GAS113]|nr:L-proline dehydrogenase /delta-1-pyrroline-5-carboxylate dehydrogenase [Rhizobiales bacterium GAS113]
MGESRNGPRPFEVFEAAITAQGPLRAAITSAYRRAEPDCVPPLLAAAALPAAGAERTAAVARQLVLTLRKKRRAGGVEGLIHEYSLSSQEGVALMCLAEALLRIPDDATRDALIRDKISLGDWRAHIGHSQSMFVNAATWGLVVTGKLVATSSETTLSSALTRLIGLGGEPLIRKGVDLAMRMMGQQFVTGQTIAEALANSRKMEARGFRYSYDMLGEAATTAQDAARYLGEYEAAIHAIGKASAGRGIYEGPGISIKLSALHPRYSRAKLERVVSELLPRLKHLAHLARGYDIGLNIDAEEADRLELSLDLLEALCFDPELAGWNGVGFVIQAYQKRCPFVIDFLIDLARRSRRRLMIRLVKGAYWDSEIKRAQVDGLDGYPVFTRKVHTDVSYLACARKLLAAPDAIFPQFATHNAQTLAAVMTMAGNNFYRGQYEFQCLHGMGEPLYEEVVGATKLDRPCRIYAPVGTHETLLAYLVRRLLENGANSSFVNRIADAAVPVDDLIADPVLVTSKIEPVGAPHPKIVQPRELFGSARPNSLGLDLSNEQQLQMLAAALRTSRDTAWRAMPLIGHGMGSGASRPVLNPADRRDIVGETADASPQDIADAFAFASAAALSFAAVSAADRAASLSRVADRLEARMPVLIGLIVREAGKSFQNAIAEIREAVDFLRYYAHEATRSLAGSSSKPVGPIVCISPWNFPLAIFTGQVAAALAAGNPVLAKPAEETPLIAAEAVRMLRESGIPADALQFLPGGGEVGAALVGDPRVRGVMFTGSTEVARLIQRQLADRLAPDGLPIPLIAETGGQNALVVDSSALAEQVVGDVIASAFDSAGQRCSALRILCLQEDIADRTLDMLKGAVAELEIGNPDRLSVDVGPVITAQAREGILAHVDAMRKRGHRVDATPLPPAAEHGTFVAPTLIEIGRIGDVEREVFGPVLHVLRFRREKLDRLVDDINATGYGLTFGLHSRIDETIARVTDRIRAGNIYVNRNTIGAVVGVQPFGGSGLSGTGPKAGGPLYLRRLLGTPQGTAFSHLAETSPEPAPARNFVLWLQRKDAIAEAEISGAHLANSALGTKIELDGPVGERNLYTLRPRGRIVALARSPHGLFCQMAALFATGNEIVVERDNPAQALLNDLPADLAAQVSIVSDWREAKGINGLLFEGDEEAFRLVNQEIAKRPGPILPVQRALPPPDLKQASGGYCLDWLMEERSISINTAAAGGNASLMAIG